MKWQQLLMAKCSECGKTNQWAGNNRSHCLGLAGHAGWQTGKEDKCPAHRVVYEYDRGKRIENQAVGVL